MLSSNLKCLFVSLLLLATSSDCLRRAEEANSLSHEVDLSLETQEASEASLEEEEDYNEAEDPEGGNDPVEEQLDEGDDEETGDEEESGTASAPPPIDFDKVQGMKKSAIWALVEEREDALKAFSGMVKGRWSKHKKQDRVIRRDWKAVTTKFDGLRAASKADQAEIDAMAGRVKAQKNEIRKLKSLVYKMR